MEISVSSSSSLCSCICCIIIIAVLFPMLVPQGQTRNYVEGIRGGLLGNINETSTELTLSN